MCCSLGEAIADIIGGDLKFENLITRMVYARELIIHTERGRETNPLTRGGRQTDFNCFFGGVFTIERSMSAPPERFPSANGD